MTCEELKDMVERFDLTTRAERHQMFLHLNNCIACVVWLTTSSRGDATPEELAQARRDGRDTAEADIVANDPETPGFNQWRRSQP
jgi:hypothetical protein